MAPAMPAMALAPTTSAPIAGAAYNHHMFGHALAILRSKGAISIAEFQKSMHLNAPQAEAIIGDFARKGLISKGFSVSGMLNAVKPNWSKCLLAPERERDPQADVRASRLNTCWPRPLMPAGFFQHRRGTSFDSGPENRCVVRGAA